MKPTTLEISERFTTVTVDDKKLPVSIFQNSAIAPSNSPDICLIVYGGSRDFSQLKLRDIKTLLCANGFIAVSFDFRGMGPDGDDFYNTGLHTRIKDTRAVFREILLANPTGRIFILGASMGGYVATFLDPKDIAGMVLVAPAAYDARVVRERINFGPNFSKIIRAERSYLNSDAFARMAKFCLVRTAIITFEEDEVVPELVTYNYFNSCRGTDRINRVFLPGKHNGTFSNPERMERIVSVLARL